MAGAVIGGAIAMATSMNGTGGVDALKKAQKDCSEGPIHDIDDIEQNSKTEDYISTEKVLLDTLWGISLGVAGAGVLFSAGGIIVGSSAAFALGALVWNGVGVLIAPLFGIRMEIIEGSKIKRTVQDLYEK